MIFIKLSHNFKVFSIFLIHVVLGSTTTPLLNVVRGLKTEGKMVNIVKIVKVPENMMSTTHIYNIMTRIPI